MEHCDPLEILDELQTIETDIPGEIDALTKAVKQVVTE